MPVKNEKAKKPPVPFPPSSSSDYRKWLADSQTDAIDPKRTLKRLFIWR